jgi:TRAP-type transport system periplasmic protein
MHILYRVVAALTVAVLATAANAQTVLRYAHTAAVSAPAHQSALIFKQRVEEKTNGALQIKVLPAGALGSDPAMLDGLRLGSIDIAVTGSAFYTRFEPSLVVADLPFLFDSEEHADRVLGGDIGRQLLDRLGKHGIKGLAFRGVGFRHLTNSRHPVLTVNDIKGLKIRTTPNPAHIKAFKLLGAIPTPLPWTETYTALDTGAVDAQENPLTFIVSGKVYEVQRYLTLTRHAFISGILSMNAAKWNALSREHQDVILEAAAFAGEKEREILKREADGALQFLREKGVEIVEDFDTAPLRAKVTEVEADYVRDYGGEIITRIRAK